MNIVEKKRFDAIPTNIASKTLTQGPNSSLGEELNQKKVQLSEAVRNSEKEKKKWLRDQVKLWMTFIIRQTIDSPFRDLQWELSMSSHTEEIFRILQKHIKTKNSKECQIFTKKSLHMIKRTEKMCLADWVADKLKRQNDPETRQLVKDYELQKSEKSEYMKILDEFANVTND